MQGTLIRQYIPLFLITVFGVFLTVWITTPDRMPWASMTHGQTAHQVVIGLSLMIIALVITYLAARLGVRGTPAASVGFWRAMLAPPRPSRPVSPNEAIEKIETMIGLSSVKREINTLIARLQIEQQRRLQDMNVTATSQHMVFTGPPGVGKTEIARQLGEIYRALGVLESGHLVEVDRSELVASYVGQTAQRTLSICKRALNGVLFIDEAYSLADSGTDGAGYGKEAIEVLLKFMEDHRSRIIVIAAGYPNEMRRFISSNPGLASRFAKTIDFPPYRSNELIDILRLIASTRQYELPEQGLERILQPWFAESMKAIDWGNARSVRNLFERICEEQAIRLASHSQPVGVINRIDLEDIQKALSKL
ncbi:AAA family ATPase [Hydrogenophaga sp.]|uniref:AAA family ATPase n=1 Tax=Hydrogenophaga sp. TaxID=1904254 RepID=UPI0035B01782